MPNCSLDWVGKVSIPSGSSSHTSWSDLKGFPLGRTHRSGDSKDNLVSGCKRGKNFEMAQQWSGPNTCENGLRSEMIRSILADIMRSQCENLSIPGGIQYHLAITKLTSYLAGMSGAQTLNLVEDSRRFATQMPWFGLCLISNPTIWESKR